MREDNLQLENRLKELRRNLDELKTKQPTAGDGWVMYRSISSDTWDINLLNVSAPYDKVFRIAHDPEDGDLTGGFAIFYYKTDYNNMINLTFGSTYYDSRDPYAYYMRVYGSGGVGSSFQMKFYVFSPKRGSLTITTQDP